MAVVLNPYISFKDSARQAMEFYKTVFGGELTTSTFADFGASDDPVDKDLVMHSQLVADGLTLMAADTPKHMKYEPPAGFSVSLSGTHDDDATLRGYWAKLAEGGTIDEPLEVAPWGDAFGMITDKFGIHWLVNIAAAAA